MTGYRVKDWAEFQHYKDRNPPWIRLHKRLLDNRKFHSLPDDSRASAPMLWLLASESEDIGSGLIPLADEDIAFRLRRSMAELHKAIKPLLVNGFIEQVQDASVPIAECEQLAVPETEAETDTEVVREKARGRKQSVALNELSVDHIADWLSQKRATGKYLTHDEHFILDYFKNYCQSKGKTYADYIAAYRNAFEWDSCQPRHASGKPNKDERAKSAVVAGVQAFRDSLAAGH